MKQSELVVVAVTLFAVAGYSQGQTQNQPPSPARSRSDEMLDRWNAIGNKLVAMAQDFPEEKYDFKLQKTSAALPRIFSTPPRWISFCYAGSPDQTSGPTSARATILRVMLSRPKPMW